MKIKFINPSPISSKELLNSEIPISDNPIPDTTHNLSSMGKRMRKKPKLMDDEIVVGPVAKKRRVSFSKSGQVGSTRGLQSARRIKPSSITTRDPNRVKTAAMIRAEEIQSTLSSEFPLFIKEMVRSHVDNGFWMGIPGYISKVHLPTTYTKFILETESEKEYELTYNGPKRGLSGGWRNFSVQENLREDDVLIFQLVEPCKFKVYVVRANDFNELDGALSLLNLEAQIESTNAAKSEKESEEVGEKAPSLSTYKRIRTKSIQPDSPMVKNKKKRLGTRSLQLAKKVENGYKRDKPSSAHPPNSESIPTFENFTIVADGLCIDSELPSDVRAKYFELCSMRNDLLHAQLVHGLHSKLIAGMIWETVDIFENIRNCSIMTCHDQYTNWDTTLKSCELLGMKVGFLRERVRWLLEVGFESDGALEMRKHVEAKLGRIRAEDEIVNLETRIVELKEASEKYSEDIESLKFKAESFQLKFQEAVDAPW